MNNYTNIKDKNITVIGLGNSGLGAARLANYLGAIVFASDSSENKSINDNAFSLMENEHIPVETGKHSNKIYDADLWVVSPGVAKTSNIIKIAQKKEIQSKTALLEEIIAVDKKNGENTDVLESILLRQKEELLA